MLTREEERDALAKRCEELEAELAITEDSRQAIIKEAEAYKAKLDVAKDALTFYANGINWHPYDGMDCKLMREDRGWRAGAALTQIWEEP